MVYIQMLSSIENIFTELLHSLFPCIHPLLVFPSIQMFVSFSGCVCLHVIWFTFSL